MSADRERPSYIAGCSLFGTIQLTYLITSPPSMFENELEQLGLTSKEAIIYTSGLELGPSPIQKIARQANIPRSTTHLIVYSLIKKGLFEMKCIGKRKLYVTRSPVHIFKILGLSENEIRAKKYLAEKIVSMLMLLDRSSTEIPTVRYFAGIKGHKQLSFEAINYSKPGDVWHVIVPIDNYRKYFQASLNIEKLRIAKSIATKTIFTTHSEKIKEKMVASATKEHAERKFLSPSQYSSPHAIFIYRDHLVIASMDENAGSIVIEGSPIAEMARQMFSLVWNSLD